jgi:hypothetical protein
MGNSGGNSRPEHQQECEQQRQAHEVSDGNKGSIGNWTKAHECYIVAKSSFTFLCVLRLCKAGFKSNGLINL